MLPIKDHAKEEAEDLEDFEATEADPEEKVKRDVRSVAKFIEVALVLDKAMFDKRPHSSRKDVIHDAIQVANIADLVSVFLGQVFSRIWFFKKISFEPSITSHSKKALAKIPPPFQMAPLQIW